MKLRTIATWWTLASIVAFLVYGFYTYISTWNTPLTEWERFTQMFTYWKPWGTIIAVNGYISAIWYSFKLKKR